MACATTTTKIWFVNNAQYSPNNSCQSLFIPVETVGKQAPGPRPRSACLSPTR